MTGKGNRRIKLAPLYGFGLSFAGLAAALPMQKLWAILLTAAVSGLIAFLLGRSSAKKEQKRQQEASSRICMVMRFWSCKIGNI